MLQFIVDAAAVSMGGSRAPFKLDLGVTYRCHSRCRTCRIWCIYQEEPHRVDEELSLQEYTRIFEGCGGCRWLGVTGGEPFLRPDLHQIIRAAYELCRHLKFLNIPTNGMHPHLVEESVRRILSETSIPHIFITVSLDGPQGVHDRVRGVEGAWEKALQTLRGLLSLREKYGNLHVSYEYTLSPWNRGAYPTMVRELEEVGFTSLLQNGTITLMHQGLLYHNLEGASNSPISGYGMEGLVGDGSSLTPLGVVREIYLKLLADYMGGGGRMLPCPAGEGSCYIDPYGDVYPCIIMEERIGALRDHSYDLREILRSPSGRGIRRAVREGRCPTCWTPCEAYPAILKSPLKSFVKAVSVALRGRLHTL